MNPEQTITSAVSKYFSFETDLNVLYHPVIVGIG
jgi:hypothetical protein